MFSEIMGPESVVERAEGVLSTGEEEENLASSVISTVPLVDSDGLADQTPNIEAQVNRFLEKTKIKTDHRKPQAIEFTAEMKKEIKPFLEKGLKIAAEYNKQTLLANLKRGEFLAETQRKLKMLKIRVFRTICAECGWSPSSAYSWIKLYKSYGEHLADYTAVPEGKLIVLASHPKAMELLDEHMETIHDLDVSALRQWVKEQQSRSQPARRARGITQMEIGPFLVKRRKDTTVKDLNDADFEALVQLLKIRAEMRAGETDEVSNALDTSLESNESDEEIDHDVFTDSTEVEHPATQIAASLPV
jgi:hypothetical protein